MYTKNLSKLIVFRVKTEDYEFLQRLSETRRCSVSDVLRTMVGGYRRVKTKADICSVYSSAVEEMEIIWGGKS